MMRTDTPVLVLRLDHYGALGVIRSLGRLGIPVYGLHRDAQPLTFASRYLRGHVIWDLDAEPPARSIERLLRFAEVVGGRPILVATNDETVRFVAANAEALRSAFRFQDNPSELVERLYHKASMSRLADELDIPTAKIWLPCSFDELRALAAAVRFPVMLKGADGIRLSQRTGEKMWIVRDAVELLERWQRAEDAALADLMVQEYIPGGEDAQWMFNGYFDARSRCLFGVTGRKLRQTPPYTGMTSLGVCTPQPVVERLVTRLVEGTHYRGILDIGFRYDTRDGRFKVLDVNPRLGATFRLFVGDDGLDVVRALYLDLTGQRVPRSRACPGRRWLVEDLDLVSCARYFADGVLRPRKWMHSFSGVKECAWFARDDLRPFAGMCGRLVARVARTAGNQLGLVAAPSPPPAPTDQHQARVTEHFGKRASDWDDVYERDGLPERILQERQRAALRFVDAVGLPWGAEVLDLGCGAGRASVEIGRRGHRVHSVDLAPQMLERTARAARAAGISWLTTALGDAHALPLDDARFDLVLALGLLPWLHTEARGLAEMARVLCPGGWLIASADNRAPLHRLLDPRATPHLAPMRARIRRLLRAPRRLEHLPEAKRHDAHELESLLGAAGLEVVRWSTVGFGPFSLFGQELLPARADLAVQERLQRLAERDWPILRSTGAHHVILARKVA
jgi:predicted ATP-grasp superfamily ATP-dependent carboligase/ubiquinone/menaquinone biosynthesis C-methylase UbiE